MKIAVTTRSGLLSNSVFSRAVAPAPVAAFQEGFGGDAEESRRDGGVGHLVHWRRSE